MTPPFGVYVHIPVCASRCDYCAFATWTDRAELMPAYAAACVASIDAGGLPPATSVFFGGGTPSLIAAPLLLSILSAIDRAPGCEVTVECNPENITAALLDAYLAGGVTRVSVGVQSAVASVLAGLGRKGSWATAERALGLVATAGFDSWNVDLIYGGAGEDERDWRRSLDAVIGFSPPHVSAYALTVEPGTPLAADVARHPDDDVQAARYLTATAVLSDAGLTNYEISNWARPGYECRHNVLYWMQGNYRGIGCAAHSHEDGVRWWNVRAPERFIDLVAAGESVVAGSERLDGPQREREALELSLRTSRGVPVSALPDLDSLVEAGLVSVDGDRAVLTAPGRLMANEVAIRLRAPEERPSVGRRR